MGGRRRQLCSDPETPEFDGGAVVPAGEQHAMGSHVPMHYIVLVAVTECFQYLAHVVAVKK